MPRSARLDAPGVLHHIMVRAIEHRPIFRHDLDQQNFLKRLEVLLPECQMEFYAWVSMKNQVHLLLCSGVTGIPQLMRRLLREYAVYGNRRYAVNSRAQIAQKNKLRLVVSYLYIYGRPIFFFSPSPFFPRISFQFDPALAGFR